MNIGLSIAIVLSFGSIVEAVTVDDNKSRWLASDAKPMSQNCIALKVDKETVTTEQDDNTCFCELQGVDTGEVGFKIVELKDVPRGWCDAHIKPGKTEIKPSPYLIIDDEDLKCVAPDTIRRNCWDQIVHEKQIIHHHSVSGNINQMVSYQHEQRRLRQTGDRTVLVVRGIALDGMAPAAEELSDAIFGTSGDAFTMRSQYSACSYGQLNFIPTPDYGVNGVYEAEINMTAVGVDHKYLRNALYTVAYKNLGYFIPNVDHTMICVPPGTSGDWVAFAIVDHWLSWFNDFWCTFPSVHIHELGHNLGLSHSGLDSKEYADKSGMMGYSYAEDDSPKMCFNGQKTYDMGWFMSYTLIFHSNSFRSWEGDLVGFVDRDNASGRPMIIRMVDDNTKVSYYIHFNRAAGFNSGTKHGANRVLVSTKGPDYEPSWRMANLGAGEQYYIIDFGGEFLNIKVNLIDNNPIIGDGVMRANISIINPAILEETPIPSAFPTKGPATTPTEIPLQVSSLGRNGPLNQIITKKEQLIDLAFNKPAAQSETLPSDNDAWVASHAVDNTTMSSNTGESHGSNWWEVNLQGIATIQQIKIYNRFDCCWEQLSGAVVSILDYSKNVVASKIIEDSSNIFEYSFENVEGSYVHISHDMNAISLGKVEVYGDMLPDLAAGKPTTQSSTLPSDPTGYWEASNAVSGREYNFHSSHTFGWEDNWWQVDLQAITSIEKIVIFNRYDCCWERLKGAEVLILDNNMEVVERQVIIEENSRIVEFNYENSVEGSYIKIYQKDNFLSIGEVEVFGSIITVLPSTHVTATN